ncbi:MAG: hypothetical protein V4864_08380 [Pseudomonadota bacterium]
MKARLLLSLFVSLLIGWPAWAQQPARPASAYVDTREECTLLGGNWLPGGDGWQSSCRMQWTREECLRLGAGWTAQPRAAAGGVCTARVSPAATARQCTEHGGTWGPADSPMPLCRFEPAAQRKPAVRAAPDANQRCDSQKDCIYGCVYSGPAVAPGADVIGRCRATNEAAGCFSMVESGRLAGRICVN